MAQDTRQDWKEAAARLIEAFASTEPTPGGGAAAGTCGAIGCALARMAAGVSLASPKADERRRRALGEALEGFRALEAEFQRLTEADADAFERVMEAYRLPKDDPGRRGRLQASLQGAARVPLETARRAVEALGKVSRAKGETVGTVSSDMACALHLLRAAGLCALENVEVNAALLKDPEAARSLRAEADAARSGLAEAR